MPVITSVNKPYPTPDDLERLLLYIDKGFGPYGLALDPELAYEHMILVKQLWHKENGRQCIHFIVSFAHGECRSERDIIEYGYKVAACFDRFQVVFAPHFDSRHHHLHFVVNSVSFVDGRKYASDDDEGSVYRRIGEINPEWDVVFAYN